MIGYVTSSPPLCALLLCVSCHLWLSWRKEEERGDLPAVWREGQVAAVGSWHCSASSCLPHWKAELAEVLLGYRWGEI